MTTAGVFWPPGVGVDTGTQMGGSDRAIGCAEDERRQQQVLVGAKSPHSPTPMTKSRDGRPVLWVVKMLSGGVWTDMTDGAIAALPLAEWRGRVPGSQHSVCLCHGV